MLKKLKELDLKVLKAIKKLHNHTNNRIMAVITHLGTGGSVWFALCIPLIISRQLRTAGLNILLSLFITWLIGEITIKRLVARVRPSEELPEDEQIIKRPKFYSFPSGHSASSFSVVAVTILRCPLWIIIPVAILAALIAFSRLYLRVHYLTDVVAGVVLGLGCGFSSVAIYNIIAEYIA
ncbi:MAG: phosphatase PAP2 family protein [Ruminococcaceae bacterium]|nr:phosphatase PAP2 family protein [Oscillospiraceae bacterium]